MNTAALSTELTNRAILPHAFTCFVGEKKEGAPHEAPPSLILPNRAEMFRPAFYRGPKSPGYRKLRIKSWEGANLKLFCLTDEVDLIAECILGEGPNHLSNIVLGKQVLQRTHCPQYVKSPIGSYVHGGIILETGDPATEKIVAVLSDTLDWRTDFDLTVYSGTRDDLSCDGVLEVAYRRNSRQENHAEGIQHEPELEKRWKIKTPASKISFADSQIGKEMWYNGERIPALDMENPVFLPVKGKDTTLRIAA